MILILSEQPQFFVPLKRSSAPETTSSSAEVATQSQGIGPGGQGRVQVSLGRQYMCGSTRSFFARRLTSWLFCLGGTSLNARGRAPPRRFQTFVREELGCALRASDTAFRCRKLKTEAKRFGTSAGLPCKPKARERANSSSKRPWSADLRTVYLRKPSPLPPLRQRKGHARPRADARPGSMAPGPAPWAPEANAARASGLWPGWAGLGPGSGRVC